MKNYERKVKKISKIINIITALVPLLFFLFFIILIIWIKLISYKERIFQGYRLDAEMVFRIISLNLFAYSFIAISFTIILLCIRLFVIKDKVSKKFIALMVIETVIYTIIFFDFSGIFTNTFG